MKNLKNTLATATLMTVLALGAVSANAGILVSDRNSGGGCDTVKNDALTQLSGIFGMGALKDGIIIIGRAGMFLSDRTGLMMSDRSKGCTASKDGIIIIGRDGILVSD